MIMPNSTVNGRKPELQMPKTTQSWQTRRIVAFLYQVSRMYPADRGRNFALSLATAAASLLALFVSASSDAPAATAGGTELTGLRPSTRQRALAPRIAKLLEEAHFSHKQIDDAVSVQVLSRYLDALDGQRSYFSAADISHFDALRTQFDDMIHSGRIDPAFEIFQLYQQRNRERLQYAISTLQTEPDWTRKESFVYDREKAAWPRDRTELDELWRQRVKSDALSLLLTGKKWPDIVETLRKRYQRVLTRVDQFKADEVFETLMNSYAAVCDPHTNYFSPINTEENRIQMSLSYEGIGASLQLEDDYVLIKNLIAGGPAAIAGTLQINDRIIAVGQGSSGPLTEVIGWRLEDVVQLIRGKGGSTVRLQILPTGMAPGTGEKTVALARGKVTLATQAAHKTLRKVKLGAEELRVGVITVPLFYENVQERAAGDKDFRSTTRDVSRLIDEFKAEGGIDALLLDLRGDGGGFLPEAQGLTGLFINGGPVVQLKHTDGRVEVLNDTEAGAAYDGPLTVLVDRTSASASEIFAGAIQDYKRGLIIGQTTFGKGTVQNQIPLDRWPSQSTDGQINVTIGKFYRVTGASTQLRGVEPDITLPSYVPTEEIGESALPFALPWDTIAPAHFDALTWSTDTVARLTRDEAQRAAGSADYQWLLSNVKVLETARKERTLSLNLAERQRERAQQDQARLNTENARRKTDGLSPLAKLEDLKADDQPDVVLAEAANISAELARLPARGAVASR
jgi:carboxyl-terminal processing protease